MEKIIKYGNIFFNAAFKIFGMFVFILGLVSLVTKEDVIITTTFKPLFLIIFGFWFACGKVKFGS